MEIYPDIVFEDKNGVLSLNYIGLIPIIVETLKEQDEIISSLQAELIIIEDELQKLKLSNNNFNDTMIAY